MLKFIPSLSLALLFGFAISPGVAQAGTGYSPYGYVLSQEHNPLKGVAVGVFLEARYQDGSHQMLVSTVYTNANGYFSANFDPPLMNNGSPIVGCNVTLGLSSTGWHVVQAGSGSTNQGPTNPELGVPTGDSIMAPN
jgi:hypothetical protein